MVKTPDEVTFEYPSYTYRATVTKVVDGDTLDVDLDVGFNCTLRKRLRLIKINAFETKGEERELGLKATARVEELLAGAERIYVQTYMDATGKYGRVLAWVWAMHDGQPVNMNETLLAEGHARIAPW